MTPQFEDHPIAAVFPLMPPMELADLADDIRAYGLRQGIVLFEGKILDGRNRYRACLKAGLDPRYEEYKGQDPVGFVVSLNLRRRDLDASQRAMIALELSNMKQGQRTDLQPSAYIRKVSQSEAADKLGVSPKAVEQASAVARKGVPELVDAVRKGEASVSAAAAVAKLKPEKQREALKGGREGVARAARTTRTKEHASEPAPRYEDESQETPEEERKAPTPVMRVVSSEQVGAPALAAAKPVKDEVPFSGVANGRKVKIEGETVSPAVLKTKEAHEWEMLTLHAVANRLLTGDVGTAAVVTKNYVVAFARA